MKLSFLHLILLALASFRFTRLLVFDKITEFLRAPFFDELQEENEDGELETYFVPKETGIKKFIGELISCYWCTGFWVSALLVGFYLYNATYALPIILIFAVAGLGAIIETVVQNLLGK